MDDWVERALARWPNVPALFGWLRLNQRGQWLIQDGVITNQRIIDVMGRNYDCDEHGRWFFQNGPQRGYVALDYTPLVLFAQPDDGLLTHTRLPVTQTTTALLDQTGALVLNTEHGPGVLSDHDLDWALDRLRAADDDTEAAIEKALTQPDGSVTSLTLNAPGGNVPIQRCDAHNIPDMLGFVREPAPREGESHT